MIVVSATEKMLALYKGKLQAIDHQILLESIFWSTRANVTTRSRRFKRSDSLLIGCHNTDKT